MNQISVYHPFLLETEVVNLALIKRPKLTKNLDSEGPSRCFSIDLAHDRKYGNLLNEHRLIQKSSFVQKSVVVDYNISVVVVFLPKF